MEIAPLGQHSTPPFLKPTPVNQPACAPACRECVGNRSPWLMPAAPVLVRPLISGWHSVRADADAVKPDSVQSSSEYWYGLPLHEIHRGQHEVSGDL